MARVAKKGTYRYKIFRALNILVRFKKKNGAYTEKEKIQKKLFQGWARGPRMLKGDTYIQNIIMLV